MLSKPICKQCVNEAATEERVDSNLWGDADDKAWDEGRVLQCPYAAGVPEFGRRWAWEKVCVEAGPPADCPYILVHILRSRDEAEQGSVQAVR